MLRKVPATFLLIAQLRDGKLLHIYDIQLVPKLPFHDNLNGLGDDTLDYPFYHNLGGLGNDFHDDLMV